MGSTKEMDEVKNFVEENEHKDKSIKQYASDRQITGHPTNFFPPSPQKSSKVRFAREFCRSRVHVRNELRGEHEELGNPTYFCFSYQLR